MGLLYLVTTMILNLHPYTPVVPDDMSNIPNICVTGNIQGLERYPKCKEDTDVNPDINHTDPNHTHGYR